MTMSLYNGINSSRCLKFCGGILSFFSIKFLDFVEQIQCSVHQENLPLEHNLLTVDMVQLKILRSGDEILTSSADRRYSCP